MDAKLAAIIGLRGASLTLRLQGLTKQAEAIDRLILTYEAGRNIDAHMQEVADGLKAGVAFDWDDFNTRLIAETDEFLART